MDCNYRKVQIYDQQSITESWIYVTKWWWTCQSLVNFDLYCCYSNSFHMVSYHLHTTCLEQNNVPLKVFSHLFCTFWHAINYILKYEIAHKNDAKCVMYRWFDRWTFLPFSEGRCLRFRTPTESYRLMVIIYYIGMFNFVFLHNISFYVYGIQLANIWYEFSFHSISMK